MNYQYKVGIAGAFLDLCQLRDKRFQSDNDITQGVAIGLEYAILALVETPRLKNLAYVKRVVSNIHQALPTYHRNKRHII